MARYLYGPGAPTSPPKPLRENRIDRLAAGLLAIGMAVMPPFAAGQDAPAVDARTSVVGTSGPRHSVSLARERHEWAVKKEKMDRFLRSAMRRHDIDMWIILSREFNPDPILDLFGGHGISGWYGPQRPVIGRR